MEVTDVIVIALIILLMTFSQSLVFDLGSYEDNVAHMLCQSAEHYVMIRKGNPFTVSVHQLMQEYPSLARFRLPGGASLDEWYKIEAVTTPAGFGAGSYYFKVSEFAEINNPDKIKKSWNCSVLNAAPQGAYVDINGFYDNKHK